jgi:hypothetical protein
VQSADYQRALVDMIARDGADLVETMDLRDTLEDLRERLQQPNQFSAWGRLTNGILRGCRRASPLDNRAQEFNLAAERYYREQLRAKHLDEALDFLEEDLRDFVEQWEQDPEASEALAEILRGKRPLEFFSLSRSELKAGNPPGDIVRRLIHLMLVLEYVESRCSAAAEESWYAPASVS